MKILTYVDLTPAQEHCLEDLQKVTCRTALLEPIIVATFKTFQGQELKMTIDKNGVIQKVDIKG